MIGIIGGYGEVGINACLLLQKINKYPFKIGGRNPEKAQEKYKDIFPEAKWEKVDIQQENSIKNFIKNCRLIINCAGPSHKTSEKIARVCVSGGCHLVDAGFEKNIEKNITDTRGLVILYAAGATPGLSGILTQWFAQKFEKINSILAYTGALDKFTPTGAEDYLEGILDETNAPMAAWKNGSLCKGILKRTPHIKLPFFQRELTAYPIFDSETGYIAKKLKIENGEWYFTVDGENSSKVLDMAGIQYKKLPGETINKLCLASSLDFSGREAYFNLLIQIQGIKKGNILTQTAIMESKGTNIISGSVAAACAIAVLEEKISSGIRAAATADNIHTIVDLLNEMETIKQLRIFNCKIEDLIQEEEGVL